MLLIAGLLAAAVCTAQGVGIGTSSPNASAQLDISSSARGLLIPRMDSNAVKAIGSPATGLMVYDTSRNELMVNTGTAAVPNWQNLVGASGWQLGGNTVSGIKSLGTLNNFPLGFVVEGKYSGQIDSAGQNAMLGYGSGSNGTANWCTAFGDHALLYGGQGNIAIGDEAMDSSRTQFGIGIGWGAMRHVTGFENIGIGTGTLFVSSGEDNTAIGMNTMTANTTGNFNVAIGNTASERNTSGVDNVAIGFDASLANTVGSYNTSVGYVAMLFNQTGLGNTAVGYQALQNTTNSYYNTVVGYNSGQAFDNGYNNVFVGANNDVTGAGFFYVIALGQAVVCTAPDQVRLGNSATNSIGGYANWTNFSDGRYKKNIREEVKGLDFIMRLRPITYNLDVTGIRTHLGQKAPADAGTQQSIAAREKELLSGFAAQEVETAAAASGYDFSGVDKPKNANDFYGLRYGDFVVPLVKAVQEQQKMIEELKQEVAELKQQLKH